MRLIFFKKRIFFICLFFLSSFFISDVLAVNLPYINKSKIRVSVIPGKQAYGEIIVENPTLGAYAMQLNLEDWYYLPSADGAKEFMPAGTFNRSCAPWITFSPSEFTIPAFGKQKINYSIRVPKDARGGYYTSLFFETSVGELPAPGKEREAGIDLRVRIATLFYVEAEGTIERKATIDNLSVTKDSSSDNLLIRLDFENTGNVDITAGASFYLMDKKGLVCARGEFNNVYTFGGGKAKLNATWKKPIPAGIYDLVITLDLGKALQETLGKRVPLITKETEIEIGPKGEVIKVGELR
jgi:hypothetical protein